MGTFFKHVVSKAGSDATASAKYLAVRHHCPLLNSCEGPGGFLVEVADVELRTAVARSRETTTRGKVVKIRFRAKFRDKETRGAHKPKLRAMPL